MSAAGTVPVTVVIAAHDEAANIEPCIDSVRWAKEIIVVENDSTDRTAEVAGAAGAKVFSNPFVTIGGQRNAAIGRALCEWILVVDADERGSPELGEEVSSVIGTNEHDFYRLPRRNSFLGSEVLHGGWEHDEPVRLFRSNLRYNDSRVHEHIDVIGEPGTLSSSLAHEPYASLDSYLEKLERYSRWWAEDRFERGERTTAASAWFRSRARFASMYFLKLGFLDGEPGLVLASLASTSVLAKYARLWELQRKAK